MWKACVWFLLASTGARAEDEFTVYELLAPDTHRFAIIYDVATSAEGSPFYFNPIRKGSKVSDESVLDRATGKALKFEIVDAKAAGRADDGQYLKVILAASVPKGGQARIRILKTYEDAASYGSRDGGIFFDRPLGIRRNVVVLPVGYELTSCTVPAIVSTQPDGRIRVSMLNDRHDQLPVKIAARRLP